MPQKDPEKRKAWELAYAARKSQLGKERYAQRRTEILARQKARLKAHPEKSRAWYLKHRPEILAKQKANDARRKEEKRAYNRRYAEANRDRILANNRAYYLTHKKERAEYWKAVKATPEGKAKIARYQKPYQKAYAVTHAAEFLERSARRKALKLQTRVEPKINYKKILRSANGLCGICRQPFDLFGIHFDHIVPLSKGGQHVTENIQATHARCNLSKGARVG